MAASHSKRCAIVELHKAGHKISAISKLLGATRQTVWRQIKRYQELGTMDDRPRSGRPKSDKTQKARQAIAVEMTANPEVSLRKMARDLEISPTTVGRIVKNELNLKPHYQQKRRDKPANAQA
ncbi:hypothetical protein WR25_26838 [Diploscapter pachys]|uniref:Transposase IS30-like HTH domain-containing protein n=1 Tax=Diploscapter pachys TaxID=2018661 RepID=A0A2A2KZV4_9BILA|nr:hypothetical protein WR25_26838 [Diploscapter pachys]